MSWGPWVARDRRPTGAGRAAARCIAASDTARRASSFQRPESERDLHPVPDAGGRRQDVRLILDVDLGPDGLVVEQGDTLDRDPRGVTAQFLHGQTGDGVAQEIAADSFLRHELVQIVVSGFELWPPAWVLFER